MTQTTLTVLSHLRDYAVTCLITGPLALGATGLLNRLWRRPFFDGWRDRLLFVAVFLAGLNVVDQLPAARLLLLLALFAGAALLGALLWAARRPRAGRKASGSGADGGPA